MLRDAEELDLILCEQATRKLSKNLTFKFERRECQLVGEGTAWKDGGKRYSARRGEATSLSPAGSRAFGKAPPPSRRRW